MPHLLLDFSSNAGPLIDAAALFVHLHDMLAETAGVAVADCKSRLRECERFLVGDGTTADAFVHLEIRLFEGRSEDVKRVVGKRALAILVGAFGNATDHGRLQITVEIREIDRSAYFKVQTDAIH